MILLTGGLGYIGSHVNKELSLRGYNTITLDNLVYGHHEFAKWGVFEYGDMGDKDFLRLIFNNYPITAIMHFAAFAYVGESVANPLKYYSNNVINTLNLLQVMLEFGVNYFIFSSSCSIYGNPIDIPIRENHPRMPVNPYGQSKVMIENILKDYQDAYGLNHISLRYFNAAGADPECEIGEWHEPETHLIPIILDAAIGKSESICINGSDYDTPDGTCIRDYIHVSDLADAHALALEYLLNNGKSEVFNLGNGDGFSVNEVINMAKKVTGKHIKVINGERRPGDPPVLVGSSEKAKEFLKWSPKYNDLSIIIETAWKWHNNYMKQIGK